MNINSISIWKTREYRHVLHFVVIFKRGMTSSQLQWHHIHHRSWYGMDLQPWGHWGCRRLWFHRPRWRDWRTWGVVRVWDNSSPNKAHSPLNGVKVTPAKNTSCPGSDSVHKNRRGSSFPSPLAYFCFYRMCRHHVGTCFVIMLTYCRKMLRRHVQIMSEHVWSSCWHVVGTCFANSFRHLVFVMIGGVSHVLSEDVSSSCWHTVGRCFNVMCRSWSHVVEMRFRKMFWHYHVLSKWGLLMYLVSSILVSTSNSHHHPSWEHSVSDRKGKVFFIFLTMGFCEGVYMQIQNPSQSVR